jgi:hypothetical protein
MFRWNNGCSHCGLCIAHLELYTPKTVVRSYCDGVSGVVRRCDLKATLKGSFGTRVELLVVFDVSICVMATIFFSVLKKNGTR